MSVPMIRCTNVSKSYRLGQIGSATLREEVHSWLAEKTGRADPDDPLISANRNKRFYALRDISFTAGQGETIGLIGRNGAGKSTLLKLISRVTAPTAGTIDLAGRVVSMLEVGSGFHREMTGRENIYLNGTILGMSKSEIDAKLDAIIDFAEIGPFLDTPVKRYSSGMYVKLAFSVAAHLESEILLMDEVLAVGDLLFQRKCLARLKEEAEKSGRTVIYVSHNMHTVRQLCGRCLVLEEGRLVFEGRTQEAISRYMQYDSEMLPEKDLSVIPRTSTKWKETAFLTYAAFTDGTDPESVRKDTVRIRLAFENRSAETKISLRVELWTLDDVAQASFVLPGLAMDPYEKEVVYDLTLDMHELIPSEYKMKYTLFFPDPFGQSLNADSVTGLYFRKESAETEASHWDTAHWGHVRLDGAAAERIR